MDGIPRPLDWRSSMFVRLQWVLVIASIIGFVLVLLWR
jgi:hypothetical protein